MCEAKQKLDWRAFEFILNHLAKISTSKKWKGHYVRAVDGTKLRLPRTADILKNFPTRYQSRYDTEEHAPLAVLVTSIDVLNGRPVGAMLGNKHSSERSFASELIKAHAEGTVNLLDRGFEGIDFLSGIEALKQFYIVRSKIPVGNNIYSQFETSRSREITTVQTSKKTNASIHIRLIKGRRLKNGRSLIVATNLLDSVKYPASEILKLYSQRWKIETVYGRSKTLLEIENFRSRTENGLRQEIFANLIIISMAASLVERAQDFNENKQKQPNTKGAIETIKNYLHKLMNSKIKIRKLISELLERVGKIFCTVQPNRSFARYSRRPINRWSFAKRDKIKKSKMGARYA